MPIDCLQKLVPPPLIPTHPHELRAWAAVEESLGTSLPKELTDFSTAYGSGRFLGEVTTYLLIANPASPDYLAFIEFEAQRLRESRDSMGEQDFPFKIFPESTGLLPIGFDDQSVRLFWLTGGDPSTWPIVVLWDIGQDGYMRIDLPLSDFLERLFSRRLLFPCWPEPFFADSLRFEPDAPHEEH